MTTTITNSDDIIDSREIIERIEQLEERNQPQWIAGWNMPGFMPDSEPASFDDADAALEYIADNIRNLDEDQARHQGCQEFADSLKADDNGELGVNFGGFHYFITKDTDGDNYLDIDEREELEALKALAAECEDCSSDWQYGEQLILRSYFEQYISDLIDECYDLPKDINCGSWPYNHLSFDIEAAAIEAEQDYTEVTFGGVEYLIRSV